MVDNAVTNKSVLVFDTLAKQVPRVTTLFYSKSEMCNSGVSDQEKEFCYMLC